MTFSVAPWDQQPERFRFCPQSSYDSRMASKHFATLAVEFETLQKELGETNDPPTRKALLTEARAKLREIERAAKRTREELSAN